jgi:hypothetical protein
MSRKNLCIRHRTSGNRPVCCSTYCECERGALFQLQVVLGSVTIGGTFSMDITSTIREHSTENDECVAPLSYFYIVLLL